MSSERSIPHLRDIFSLSGYSSHNNNTQNNNDKIGSEQIIPQIVDTKKHTKKRRDNNKTLTSGDVKTLERHLSMKKTIRKKIMRDLQQAFVEDPNEFRTDNTSSEHLKAEINTEALSFGDNKTTKTDNFLDMLRGDNNKNKDKEYNENSVQNRGYSYETPITPQSAANNNEKTSFWRRFTMKNKIKR